MKKGKFEHFLPPFDISGMIFRSVYRYNKKPTDLLAVGGWHKPSKIKKL